MKKKELRAEIAMSEIIIDDLRCRLKRAILLACYFSGAARNLPWQKGLKEMRAELHSMSWR